MNYEKTSFFVRGSIWILSFLSLLIIAVLIFVSVYLVSKRVSTSTKASGNESFTLAEKILNGSAVRKKIWLIIFNPVFKSKNLPMSQYYNWNDPEKLTDQLIKDFKEVSGDYLNYEIAGKNIIDDFPRFKDGFKYTEKSFRSCWEDPAHSNCHTPTGNFDYKYMLSEYDLCTKLNRGELDEVWLWAAPYLSYWEAAMAGPGAFDINGEVIGGTSCKKKLPIMGFNFERGLGAALESYGHRVENTMAKVFNTGWDAYNPNWKPVSSDPWTVFTTTNKQKNGQARCGYMHYAPQTTRDYDWNEKGTVLSACDDFLNYPNLPEKPNFKEVNCETWGCDPKNSDIWLDHGYYFKKWWYSHLPKADYYTDGIANNWWKYVVSYDETLRTKVSMAKCEVAVYEDEINNRPGKYFLKRKIDNAFPGQRVVLYQVVENIGNTILEKPTISMSRGSFPLQFLDSDKHCGKKDNDFNCSFDNFTRSYLRPIDASGGAVRVRIPTDSESHSPLILTGSFTSKQTGKISCSNSVNLVVEK